MPCRLPLLRLLPQGFARLTVPEVLETQMDQEMQVKLRILIPGFLDRNELQ